MIKTTNKEWGFYGTAQRNYNIGDEAMERLFDKTASLLVRQMKASEESVVAFLDSKYGRHFADELSFHGAKHDVSENGFLTAVRKFLNLDRAAWVVREVKNQEMSK